MQKTFFWTKLVYSLGGLIALSVGALVLYAPQALSEVLPATTLYISDDPRWVYAILALGVLLLVAAFLARLRSLIGLLIASLLTVAAFWYAMYSESEVWLLALFWCGGLIGVFTCCVYLIAFFRGRDAF